MVSYLPAFDQLSSLSRLNLGLSSLSLWQHGRAVWRVIGQHFPVAAQGHALPKGRLTIHICSHHFCFIAPFSELPSQDFCYLFSHPPSYLLTVSILHAVWAVRERSLGMGGGGLQTPSKWLQQLEGCHAALILALLPTGVCWHLAGNLWHLGPTGTPLGPGDEPASFHCSCSLQQRGRAEELEAMTFQALQMFAQWMWVSLISKLFVISVALL